MGKSRLALVGVAMAVSLAACGQNAEPEIVARGCSYSGPETMSEGTIPVAFRVTGLGSYGLLILEIESDRTFEELEDYYSDNEDPVDNPPVWVRTIALLDAGDLFDEESASENVSLTAGEYAVVCVNYPYDSDELVTGELMSKIVVTD